MNGFPEAQTAETFKRPEYWFLVVANKFQTGFDQPLLHTMRIGRGHPPVEDIETLSEIIRQLNERFGTSATSGSPTTASSRSPSLTGCSIASALLWKGGAVAESRPTGAAPGSVDGLPGSYSTFITFSMIQPTLSRSHAAGLLRHYCQKNHMASLTCCVLRSMLGLCEQARRTCLWIAGPSRSATARGSTPNSVRLSRLLPRR